MDDKEKIRASIAMLRQLKRMVGFFMKKEISELIMKLESDERISPSRKKTDAELN